jgi:hypothetical protein
MNKELLFVGKEVAMERALAILLVNNEATECCLYALGHAEASPDSEKLGTL